MANFLRFAIRFDAAYDDEVGQADVFDAEVSPHLASLFRGINSTIFCYGMTGAGSYPPNLHKSIPKLTFANSASDT
jgi:hypothetical protein